MKRINLLSICSSGSSSGSGSLPHSFSVDEIQKVRTQLKSSKSYPNDFLLQQQKEAEENCEDGDNSSSGVSSDQDVPTGQSNNENDYHIHRVASNDDKVKNRNQTNSMTLPSSNKIQRVQQQSRNSNGSANGMLTRHAVSLAQLPPPIEGDSDEKEEVFVPPPPEFIGGNSPNATVHSQRTNTASTEPVVPVVLAPPPQFSDRLGKVRIVGAVPKTSSGKSGGRLHSQ